MPEVMIDLETLSVLPNAIITTIGAVKFDRDNSMKSLENCDTFYHRISIDSCKKVKLKSDQVVLDWWNTQPKEVKYEALENPDRESLHKVLAEFSKWFEGCFKIWGHGDDFDCVILANAYRACDMTVPWKFWNTRDTRTLFDLANISMKDLPQDNKHHAISDAYRQVIGVKKSLKKLSLLKVCNSEIL